jgi:hypothetical protein
LPIDESCNTSWHKLPILELVDLSQEVAQARQERQCAARLKEEALLWREQAVVALRAVLRIGNDDSFQ